METRWKSRAKSLEKEVKEMGRWKGLAKQYEKELKEAHRWKVVAKQGKTREKALEKDAKELFHWRQRARAFEKEVKELRTWKRQILDNQPSSQGSNYFGGLGMSTPYTDFSNSELIGTDSLHSSILSSSEGSSGTGSSVSDSHSLRRESDTRTVLDQTHSRTHFGTFPNWSSPSPVSVGMSIGRPIRIIDDQQLTLNAVQLTAEAVTGSVLDKDVAPQ